MFKLSTVNGTPVLELASRLDLSLYLGNKCEISSFEFDGIIKISNGTVSVRGLFAGCTHLNCPIVLPYGLNSCENMLSGCIDYNYPIILPPTVLNCAEMLRGCTMYNQPVILPEGVLNCKRMLKYCTRFNQPVVVPASVNTDIGVFEMFDHCSSMNMPIIFQGHISDVAAVKAIGGLYGIKPENVHLADGLLSDIYNPNDKRLESGFHV